MKIEDQFRVDVPIEEAWRVLLDVERIAPCMPGAQLQEIEGDEYRGVVKVKVGPITAQYKGAAKIIEADEAARRIVLKGEGRDTRGQGNASALVTVLLAEDGSGTNVSVDTDLNVTGKVAQFGRGVMADVSAKLLGQFVKSLEENVLGADEATADAAAASVIVTTDAEPDARGRARTRTGGGVRGSGAGGRRGWGPEDRQPRGGAGRPHGRRRWRGGQAHRARRCGGGHPGAAHLVAPAAP